MVIIQATYRRPTRLSSHFSHNYRNFFFVVESTVVPKHAVKAYGGSGGTDSLINLAKQGPVGATVSLVTSKNRKIHSSSQESNHESSILQPAA